MKKSNGPRSSVSASVTATPPGAAVHTSTRSQSAHRSAPDDALLRGAFQRVEPEFAALTPEQLLAINVDARKAVSTVLDAEPHVKSIRGRIAKLPEFDLRFVDKLRDYTLALWFTDNMLDLGEDAGESLAELGAQTSHARDQLFVAAQALAAVGVIPANKLASLRQSTAYVEIADDVIKLVLLFNAAWESIAGRTAVTREELDAADALAHRLADAVHHRDNAPTLPSELVRNRQCAYTLFRRAYDQVRRAVVYLYGDGPEADAVLPSIFIRGPHATATKPAGPPPPPPALPPAPEKLAVPAAHVPNPARIASPFVDDSDYPPGRP